MKFKISFLLVFFTGFVNLSGGVFGNNQIQEDCFSNSLESILSNYQNFTHIDAKHGNNLDFKIAEFEIEESNTASKHKTTQLAGSALAGTLIDTPGNLYFRYKYLKTKARSSISAAVKPYILFQVFRL